MECHTGFGHCSSVEESAEQDLCRRMPTLYTSLYNAKREPLEGWVGEEVPELVKEGIYKLHLKVMHVGTILAF